MKTTLNTRPLYLQIRDIFSERIATAQWRSREPIPNEYELSREIGVSIGTIRKAMDILVAEGQVTRKQGRGTFVADRESPQFTERIDRLRNADGSRIAWLKPIVSHVVASPNDVERSQLRLTDPEAMVIRIVRVRRDRGGPLKYEKTAVPCSRFPLPEALFYVADGIVSLSHACKITVGPATVKISVAAVDEEVARALDVAEGTSLMQLRRIVADVEGLPIECSISWYALKDQYFLTVH